MGKDWKLLLSDQEQDNIPTLTISIKHIAGVPARQMGKKTK